MPRANSYSTATAASQAYYNAAMQQYLAAQITQSAAAAAGTPSALAMAQAAQAQVIIPLCFLPASGEMENLLGTLVYSYSM